MAVQTDALDVILRVIGARSFQTAMTESRATVAGLGREVRKTGAEMEGMAAKTKVAGAAMETTAKLGIIGVGVAAGYAIKNSIEYQKQMTMLQTQAGATANEVKEMHKRVLELARVRPQGPEELAKGLFHLESVFQNTNTAYNALAAASKGAAVGNANLEETATALGAALRAIYRDAQPTVKQIDDTMSTLNATVGVGRMRMDDLALALGTAVVPAGAQAGLTLKDIGGALATLTDEGQRADNAATHLRMAFTLMGAQSKIAQKNLSEIGIKADELDTIMQMSAPGEKLVNALKFVREKLSAKFPVFGSELPGVHNLKDAQALAGRFQTISKAFGGARSSATIMLLLNNLDLLQEKTDMVTKKTGGLNHAFEIWGKTADAKVRTSLSDLQSSLTEFGDSIRDNAIAWITKFIHFLTALVDHIDQLIAVIGALVAALVILKGVMLVIEAEAAISAFAAAIPILIEFAGAVTGIGDAMALLGIGIEATPVGWIVTAIALVILAIYMLVKHWKFFWGLIKDFWVWLKEHWGFAFFIPVFGPFLSMIGFIGSHWKQLKPIFKSVIDWLAPAFKAVADTVKSIFGHIIGYIKGAIHIAVGVINFMIRAYNKLPGFMRPTGQIMPIGGWGVNEGPNKGAKLIPGSMPMAFGGPGPLTSGFGPANSIGRMPGGGIATAHSLRRPRAHTPDPEPVLGDPLDGLENHVHVHLDGKEIFKSVSKHAADKKARK